MKLSTSKFPVLAGAVALSLLCTKAAGQNASIFVDAAKVENKITPWLYGSCMEDVNHEIYGGLYDQRIFGESFEEPAKSAEMDGFSRFGGFWQVNDGILSAVSFPGAKIVYDPLAISDGTAEVDIKFDNKRADNAGLLVRVSEPGNGADTFNGYEISISGSGKKVILGKHRMNWEPLAETAVTFDPLAWNRLGVKMDGARIQVLLNGKTIIDHEDKKAPLMSGNVSLRTWSSDVRFKDLTIKNGRRTMKVPFKALPAPEVSAMWTPVQTGSAVARFAIDTTSSYNAKQSQKVTFVSGKGTAAVANMGLNHWGIALRKGQKMAGHLYLRTETPGAAARVALQSEDGSKQYATGEITGITGQWKRYDFELTSSADDPKARFVVGIDRPGSINIDQVVLMSTGKDQFRGLPLRNDIGQAMVDQGLTFLRYGGTMVNAPEYRFKKMIGDRDKRPNYKGHWYNYSTNGFGIEEFLQFCEKAGFVPSFAINVEETPEDMADMIEYLNGPATSTWGRKRAEAGHPEPYNVKYIEIGNEEVIWGDIKEDYQHYIDRFNIIRDAIMAKDPNVVFINAAWWRPDSPENMEMVFRALDGKSEYWDYHPWADDPNSGRSVDRELTQMQDMFKSWNPDTDMKCALFEENGNTHNMARALGHVTIQNAARRHGEFLLTTCAANALQPYLQNDNGWDQGQVFFTPAQVWGMPPYYAQQMASKYHKPLRIYSRTEGGLDVSAATDTERDEVMLYVVNTGAKEITSKVTVDGLKEASLVKSVTLSGDLKAANTPQEPEKIVPVERKLDLGSNAQYTFPAHSYTILVYKKAADGK